MQRKHSKQGLGQRRTFIERVLRYPLAPFAANAAGDGGKRLPAPYQSHAAPGNAEALRLLGEQGGVGAKALCILKQNTHRGASLELFNGITGKGHGGFGQDLRGVRYGIRQGALRKTMGSSVQPRTKRSAPCSSIASRVCRRAGMSMAARFPAFTPS